MVLRWCWSGFKLYCCDVEVMFKWFWSEIEVCLANVQQMRLGDFEVIWGWLWCDFEACLANILQLVLSYFKFILMWYWVILRWCWSDFEVMYSMYSKYWAHVVVWKWFWGDGWFSIDFDPCLTNSEQMLWGDLEVILNWYRGHFEVILDRDTNWDTDRDEDRDTVHKSGQKTTPEYFTGC